MESVLFLDADAQPQFSEGRHNIKLHDPQGQVEWQDGLLELIEVPSAQAPHEVQYYSVPQARKLLRGKRPANATWCTFLKRNRECIPDAWPRDEGTVVIFFGTQFEHNGREEFCCLSYWSHSGWGSHVEDAWASLPHKLYLVVLTNDTPAHR